MCTGTHLEMHRQHRQWLQDAELWVEQAELWMRENQKAAAAASPLTYELNQYVEEIAVNHAELNVHTRAIKAHDHLLAMFEMRGEQEDMLLLAKRHHTVLTYHERQQSRHSDIKQRHHALMAEWMQFHEKNRLPQLEATSTAHASQYVATVG